MTKNSIYFLFVFSWILYLHCNIESALLEPKPGYQEIWNKKLTIVSDQMPFDMLTKITGPSELIKNFHYRIKANKSNESCYE